MSEVIEGEAVDEEERSTDIAERVASPVGEYVPAAYGALLLCSYELVLLEV
jgi:hypothetical protein